MNAFDHTPSPCEAEELELDRLARQRAGRKMGWYLHATVYLIVNVGLAVMAAMDGRNWAVYPMLGWGLGLAIHGFVVFVAPLGGGLHQRLVEREREALRRERTGDRW